MEFVLVAHKAIPELMLPQASKGTTPGVESQRHEFPGVVQHLPDQQRRLRPDQTVPLVRHRRGVRS